ncbi:MAG: hypothetical protein IT183_04310 [Acidobacteria bacterium]|nr:hypothetical protein [Acidobacteriota bacterium]
MIPGSVAADGTVRTFDDWQGAIRRAVDEPDPVLGNLLITVAHDDLSRALACAIGPDAGANFHTWAVWGSKKAGETIRLEDTRTFRRTVLVASLAAAGLLAAVAMVTTHPPVQAAALGVALATAAVPSLVVTWRLRCTRRAVLHGNRIVLDDIGIATARYVSAVASRHTGSLDDQAFIREVLDDGRTTGGHDLLARAFVFYDRARREVDRDRRHEAMLMANCCAILHEHQRLQPFIDEAMPTGWRRYVTSRDLRFRLGPSTLQVCHDLAPVRGQAFPETLRQLDLPELVAFMRGPEGWDRTPDDLGGSRAEDWSRLDDRMNFIVDLFRSRHLSPDVWAAAFTDRQAEVIRSGRVPDGPL